MDLNSLPDEVLTVIIKKMAFQQLNELRKINKKVDRLARRARINERIPVEKIDFYFERVQIVLRKSDAEYLGLNCNDVTIELNSENKRTLEDWLNRLQIRDSVSIDGRTWFSEGSHVDIRQLMNKMRNSMKNTQTILFACVNFINTKDTVISECEKYGLKLLTMINCHTYDKITGFERIPLPRPIQLDDTCDRAQQLEN